MILLATGGEVRPFGAMTPICGVSSPKPTTKARVSMGGSRGGSCSRRASTRRHRAMGGGWAAARGAPRRLRGRTRAPSLARRLHGGGAGVRRGRGLEPPSGGAPPAAPTGRRRRRRRSPCRRLPDERGRGSWSTASRRCMRSTPRGWNGIPITTVPRTLLDLAPRLARCRARARVPRRLGPPPREAARNRGVHRPQSAQAGRTEAAASARLRRHAECARGRLPRAAPQARAAAAAYERRSPRRQGRLPLAALDLTVELLSYRFHASRKAFEADVARRRRSNHIAFTYGDVFERGEQTIAELRRAIRA